MKDKVDYKTAVQQYNRAIQTSPKPASLIIDALKLDYQNEENLVSSRNIYGSFITHSDNMAAK